MELKRHHVEDFIKAYKHDVGEELTYAQAFEILHRLVNIFLILDKAVQKEAQEYEQSDEQATA